MNLASNLEAWKRKAQHESEHDADEGDRDGKPR